MNLSAMLWYDDDPTIYIEGKIVKNTDEMRIRRGLVYFRKKYAGSNVAVIRVATNAETPSEIDGIPVEHSENVRMHNYLFFSERRAETPTVLLAEPAEESTSYSDIVREMTKPIPSRRRPQRKKHP